MEFDLVLWLAPIMECAVVLVAVVMGWAPIMVLTPELGIVPIMELASVVSHLCEDLKVRYGINLKFTEEDYN